MKKMIVSLLFIASSLAMWSQQDSYGKISMTSSYYTGWDNVNWGAGTRTYNLQAFDTEFRYAINKNWGVWGRATLGMIDNGVSGLKWQGFDDPSYLKSADDFWNDDYHFRSIFSVGVSYSYERGRFRIVPKLGFGSFYADDERIWARVKVKNSNEEYEVQFENDTNIALADLGLEFNYKVWKVVYATAGFRYIQGLGKYKQERKVSDVYGESAGAETEYRSKLPNHFGMHIGIGVTF